MLPIACRQQSARNTPAMQPSAQNLFGLHCPPKDSVDLRRAEIGPAEIVRNHTAAMDDHDPRTALPQVFFVSESCCCSQTLRSGSLLTGSSCHHNELVNNARKRQCQLRDAAFAQRTHSVKSSPHIPEEKNKKQTWRRC